MFKVFEEYDNHTEEILKTAAIVTGVIILTVVLIYVAAPAVIAAINSAAAAGTAGAGTAAVTGTAGTAGAGTAAGAGTTAGAGTMARAGTMAGTVFLKEFFTVPSEKDIPGIVNNVKDVTQLLQDEYDLNLKKNAVLENVDGIMKYADMLEVVLNSDEDDIMRMPDKLEIISVCAESVGQLAGTDEKTAENAEEILKSSREILKMIERVASDRDFDVWDAADIAVKIAKIRHSASEIYEDVSQHQEESAVQVQSLQNSEPMTVIFGEVSET